MYPPSRTETALGRMEEEPHGCGVVHSNNSVYLSNMLRIIGGRPTQQGKWPWQVAILNRFKVSASC
jgi:hypothetical protein